MLLWIYLFLPSLINSQSYSIKHYSQEDGLPNAHVYSILQDNDGKIWVGTRNGIGVYDGVDWSYHNVDIGMQNSEVCGLEKDSAGFIWVQTSRSKLNFSYFDGKDWKSLGKQTFNLHGNLELGSFSVINKAGVNELMVISHTYGLFYFDGKKWRIIKEGLENIRCYDITVYKNKFYISTSSGVALFDNENISFPFSQIITKDHSDIVAFEVEKGKTGDVLWLLGKNHLSFIKDNRFTIVNDNLNIVNRYKIQPLQFVPEYYGHAVWSTFYGLFFLNKSNGSFLAFRENSGISVINPAGVYLDKEWNLWLGGYQGLNKISSLRFVNYKQISGLLTDEVSAITGNDRNVIFGHVNGLSILSGNKFGQIKFSGESNAYNFNKVLDLKTDKNNIVWIAGESNGLGKLLPNGSVQWSKIPVDCGESLNSVAIDSKGNVFAISNKVLLKYSDGKLQIVYRSANFESPGYYRKLLIDNKDRFYITTITEGILVIENGKKIRNIYSRSAPKANDVYSVYFEPDKLIVGTLDGLYISSGDSLIKANSNFPVINSPVYSIVKDHENNFWFGTNSGVVKWDGRNKKQFTVRSGLAGMETNRSAAFVDKYGYYWIGTDRGVSKYLKQFDGKPNFYPPVAVETIEPYTEYFTPSKENIIKATSANIVFRVKVLSFINEDQNRFAYKLEGFENSWNFSHSRNSLIRYANLSPGNYNLIVKGQNAEGMWSGEYFISKIEIPVPFYNTWWFYAIMIIFSLSLFLVYVSNRLNKKYSLKLKSEVVKRTKLLDESERRYRQMFEKNNAIMLLLDAETLDIVDVNEAAERFYGEDRVTLINFNYSRLSTAGSIEEIEDRILDSILNKKQKVSVHRVAGGLETFVEINFSEIYATERKLYYAIIHDVGSRIYAEEALKESETKYRTLIESMTDGVFLIKDEKLIFVNNTLAVFLGYKPEEMIGNRFEGYIAPEDLELVKNRYAARLRGENVINEYQVKLLHKNGTTRVSVILHVRIFSFQGKPASLGTVKNITDTIQKELKLKQFYTAIEQAPVGVMITDFENVIEYVNPKFSQMSGYSFMEIIGQKPFILQSENLASSTEGIRKEIRLGKTWSGEVLNKRKNGSNYWVMATVSPIRNIDGHITHFISLEQDITFEKYAREQIKQNEKLLSSILNHVPVIITAVDKKGNITFCRGIELENKGTPNDALVGISIFDRFNNNSDLIRDFERAMNGETFSSVALFEGKYAYEIHYTPIFDDLGDFNGSIAVASNITERYNTQQKLLAAKEEAERSDRLKSEFLAQVSHEIRTPVNTILNFTSLLQEELKNNLSDELNEVFNFIDDGGRRLIRTIDMILNMSQFQTGTYKPIMNLVDLDKDILNKIIQELKSLANHKNLELNLSVKTHNTLVKADSYTVGQIFINLIDNSIKYTHQGKIDVRLYESGNKIVVEVEDTGIGIAREFIPHLFDAFSQEESGYSRRFEGTGLGLALVKKYLEINKAEIAVESMKGEGTKFLIYFSKPD